MKKNLLAINTFFAVICAVFIYKTSFAEPPNLELLKQKVVAYHDSGEYQKELAQAISRADHFIVDRAIANSKKQHPQKLAVVLDIDETSLSNYDKIVARQFVVDHQKINKEYHAANAPAIQPMLVLYNDALKHGVSVFFVTGRKDALHQVTEKNLSSIGYHHWAGIYFKPNNYQLASAIPFKSQTRATITKLGYTIIASIGDQYSDLKGGYAEKTFKLPNPYYYIP